MESWRYIVVNGVIPLLLVLAGAGSTIGGEFFESAALQHQSSGAHSIVMEVPSGPDDESYTVYHNHQSLVASPDKSKDSHHDCPAAVRAQLRTLGVWNDLQDIHKELESLENPTDSNRAFPVKLKMIDERQEKIDLARDRLKALLERLAPCGES